MINVKAPSGTRLEVTDQYIARVEQDIRSVIPPRDLGMIVSNIGITSGFESIYTSNSGESTAFVNVALKKGHSKSSFAYMNLVRAKLRERSARALHLFPKRQPGRCGRESWPARSHRHPGGGKQHEGGLRHRQQSCRARYAS